MVREFGEAAIITQRTPAATAVLHSNQLHIRKGRGITMCCAAIEQN